MQGDNILVTGGNGLLGSSIQFGHKPTSKELNLLNTEEIIQYLKKNPQIDTIIHAAGLVGGVSKNTECVYDFFSQNLRMGLNVMDAIAASPKIKHGTLVLSTCIFPENVKYPVDVDVLHAGEPHPTNYGYAYAKRMLGIGAKALNQQYGKHIKCLIPCNLYGPNDNYNLRDAHVIPSLIHKCYLAKREGNDHFCVWGSGNAEREFIYAPDFGEIFKAIHIDHMPVDDMMVVSSDKEYRIKDVVDIIVKHLDFTGKIVYDETRPEGILRKPTIKNSFTAFSVKSNIKLTSLEDGLKSTIDNFVRNFNNVKK
jgi:GDP-L-fucose synthase